jgi:hypothetical protein
MFATLAGERKGSRNERKSASVFEPDAFRACPDAKHICRLALLVIVAGAFEPAQHVVPGHRHSQGRVRARECDRSVL